MKVTQIISTLDRGGAEHHLLTLCAGLRRQGAEVQVIALYGRGELEPNFKELGIEVKLLGLRSYWRLDRALEIASHLRCFSPDLVHAHMPPAELFAVLALNIARKPQVPLIVTRHNDERFWRLPFASLMSRVVSARASFAIAISQAVAQFLRAENYLKAGLPLEVIHYGVEETHGEASGALRSALGATPGDLVLLSVARLVPQKSLHTLIDAVAELRSRGEVDPYLAIVGDGPLREELERRIDELQLGARVKLLGKRCDVPSLLRDCNVFCLSSVYEGFGLVLLEAMSASVPVIASRVSAIPEVVADQQTGILVEAGDAAGFADAILRLSDTELRDRYGRAGSVRAKELFSNAEMVRRIQKLYGRIVSLP